MLQVAAPGLQQATPSFQNFHVGTGRWGKNGTTSSVGQPSYRVVGREWPTCHALAQPVLQKYIWREEVVFVLVVPLLDEDSPCGRCGSRLWGCSGNKKGGSPRPPVPLHSGRGKKEKCYGTQTDALREWHVLGRKPEGHGAERVWAVGAAIWGGDI